MVGIDVWIVDLEQIWALSLSIVVFIYGLFRIVHLVIFEFLRGQEAIADLLCLKIIGHFFVFARQLRLHFSFTQGRQQVSIIGGLLDEFLAELGKTDDLV